MKEFNHALMDTARGMFYKVYADQETPTEYRGSLDGYKADRIRIYITDWTYTEPETARNDAELQRIIEAYTETI